MPYWSIYCESWERRESESCSVLSTFCNPMDFSPWNSPGQNTREGSLSLIQGVFPTQGSISGLLHCRQILYQLSHKGSPRILEWVAYPFSRGSSQPKELNQSLLHCGWILYQLSYQGCQREVMVCLIILSTDAYRPSLERLIKQKMKSKGWSAYSVIECGDLCKLTHVHLNSMPIQAYIF